MSNEKLIRMARDWQAIATREAAEYLGTPEGAARLVEAKRYGLLADALATQRQAEPVAYQYQNRNGVWCPFMDERHYESTVADGSWPIRALYTGPVASAADEVTDAQPMVSRSVAQRAVNHASLGTPGSLSDATKMLDAAMQKETK